jgi:hypothetical protein
LVRWGLVKHPYGQEYARDRYTLTGRRRPDTTTPSKDYDARARTRAGIAIVGLVLASLLATGLLFSL